ncbi:hypothetical protein [Croceimicrobium hydrocarbonivorans]|uniref:Uncharacterized protein n=1 Tax=Croceimicrobium hydrocarbonivorans TaxID=2761580 RepID=A0A7H0VHI4_9FLAO|nr:hypothetical protein [Croceimicrobium hydrocarbonivorans]QNR25182.1 hypothetical protein H4K34_04905 [Croceimicrobium hydrocarbonivorans]
MPFDILSLTASMAGISGFTLKDVIKQSPKQRRMAPFKEGASQLRILLASLEEVNDPLVGYWDLAHWEIPPKSTSVKGKMISGGLAIHYRERNKEIWHGIMCHSVYDKRGFWDKSKKLKGEPPFIATYKVRFEKENQKIIGRSQMLEKVYTSRINRIRARIFQGQTHSYRGEFSNCRIKDGDFMGNFELTPSSGQISFRFHLNRKWAQINDDLHF